MLTSVLDRKLHGFQGNVFMVIIIANQFQSFHNTDRI